MNSLLNNASVRRVQAVLRAAGSPASIVELTTTARSAQDAASSICCPLGAIVKSLVFRFGDDGVIALIAGDRHCDTTALADALGLNVKAGRADAAFVRSVTGFAIGGVAPIGHPAVLPTAIDASLGRFEQVYAAAGHPHCVFPTSLTELKRLTGGAVAMNIAQ